MKSCPWCDSVVELLSCYRNMTQRPSCNKDEFVCKGCGVTVNWDMSTHKKIAAWDKRYKPKKKFTPPTLADVQAYAKDKGYSVDAKKFVDYYTESDWKDNKGKPVKNWKLKVISWSDNGSTQNNQTQRKAHRGVNSQYTDDKLMSTT